MTIESFGLSDVVNAGLSDKEDLKTFFCFEGDGVGKTAVAIFAEKDQPTRTFECFVVQ